MTWCFRGLLNIRKSQNWLHVSVPGHTLEMKILVKPWQYESKVGKKFSNLSKFSTPAKYFHPTSTFVICQLEMHKKHSSQTYYHEAPLQKVDLYDKLLATRIITEIMFYSPRFFHIRFEKSSWILPEIYLGKILAKK